LNKAPSVFALAHLLVGEQRFALANNGSPWRIGSHFAGASAATAWNPG